MSKGYEKSKNENHNADKLAPYLVKKFPSKFRLLTKEEKKQRKCGDIVYNNILYFHTELKFITTKTGTANQLRSDLYLPTIIGRGEKNKKDKSLKVDELFVIPPNDLFNYMLKRIKNGLRGQHTNDPIANCTALPRFYSKYKIKEQNLCTELEKSYQNGQNDSETKRRLSEYKKLEEDFINKVKQIQ